MGRRKSIHTGMEKSRVESQNLLLKRLETTSICKIIGILVLVKTYIGESIAPKAPWRP